MKDTIRYYDRNNVLRLTLNEYPYYSEPSDLKDWLWGFNEQFGVINTFYRNKTEYELVIGIAGDYLPHHDALCDIFSADVIANEPGYLELRGWRLPCYIVEASYEYGLSLDRQAKFRVRSVNSTWIRTNTRSYNGVPGGGLGGEDFGRDYIFSYVPPEKYEDTGEIIKIENDEENLTLTSLSVSLSPIQDLNGYDKPWVGGAGKNLADKTTALSDDITVTVGDDGKLTLNGTSTKAHYVRGLFNCADSTATYTWALFNSKAYSSGVEFSIRNADASSAGGWARVNAVNKTFTFTPDGNPTLWQIQINSGVTFNNDVIFPMIVSGSVAPTTFEPYSNICPISGRTSVETTRTGKNLLNDSVRLLIGNGIYFGITTSQDKAVHLKAGTYTYSVVTADGETTNLYGLDLGTNRPLFPNSYNVTSKTFTIDHECDARVWVYKAGYTSVDAIISAQIELGTTATAYEPYNGQTYTTALGRAVYGGTLDVVSGVLTVDRAMVDLTQGMSGGTISGNYLYYKQVADAKTVPNSQIANVISEAYEPIRYNGVATTIGTIAIRDNKYLYVNTGGQDTLPTGNAVYELATPQTYQLTPQQISLLLGENNLWTNTGGTIDVKYETISVPFPARGYNYGYSQPESHAAVINLPGTGNGYEIIVYGPQTNPVIYLNNQPVQVNVELSAQQRLRIVSNGSVKTIEILSSSGQATDAFVYRDKENTPFLTLGQHTDLTFGQIRFDFTTIERRSEPTWT